MTNWTKIICGIDKCGAEIGVKSPHDAKKQIEAHRKSAHPNWKPPPDKRRAPRLD